MLKLLLKKAALLKNVLEALSDLFPEAYFDISRKGLKLQAMDTNHVALVEFFLPADAFDDSRCDDDLSMGLSLADMAKASRGAKNDDIMTIKVYDNSFQSVTFKFQSSKYGTTSRYDFDTVVIEELPIPIPESMESKYLARVRMPSALFMDICEKLSIFANSGDRDTVVTIRVDEGRVNFRATGETGTSTITCRQTHTEEQNESTLVEMKEKVSLAFDLRCIISASKVSTLSDQVTISLSSYKNAAVFTHKIPKIPNNGYIKYYIMPRKEDEMQNEGDDGCITDD